jgi:hypothetical protein
MDQAGRIVSPPWSHAAEASARSAATSVLAPASRRRALRSENKNLGEARRRR